jgi:Protein of unknown function (DUF2996)
MLEKPPENVTPSAKPVGGKTKLATPAEPVADTPTAKKAVKEKPPAVESKPFIDFIQQDYLPALTKALADRGVTDLHVVLERSKIAVKGFETASECSQVIGSWNDGQRQFNVFEDGLRNTKATQLALEFVKSDPDVDRIITERYTPPPVDIDALFSLPTDSLGHIYAAYIKKSI